MPVNKFTENLFAVQVQNMSLVTKALGQLTQPTAPDPATTIAQHLARASQFFLKRQYLEAINAYAAANALLGSLPPAAANTPPENDPHYVIAFGLAESNHAIGDFEEAAAWYERAATVQTLANNSDASRNLWLRLATLCLDWGNSLYRADAPTEAMPVYNRLLLLDDKIPETSSLYSQALLKPGADIARRVVGNLFIVVKAMGDPDSLTLVTSNPQLIEVNPVTLALLLEARQQILKIQAGLDFWGHWHASVPIWTFDYLQSAAVNFCNLAINAEKDTINFWSQADQGKITRQQLQQSLVQSQAEIKAAQSQAEAAKAEVSVYQAGLDLAKKRASDAEQNAQDYEALSEEWIVNQAVSAQLAGGADGNSMLLEEYADKIQAGPPYTETGQYLVYNSLTSTYETKTISYQTNKLRGQRGTLSAARQLVAARLNREYEVASLQRQAQEMDLAVDQSQKEVNAAQKRLDAARHATSIAYFRAQAAQDNLNAFNAQRFTPEVWHAMGDVMYRLYRRYLDMALRTARLMQQAYNFENDSELRLIKSDYTAEEVSGLLGADALMADIQSFTYHQLTTQTDKPQPVKQTISLAERYGYLFESQLRQTGMMEFQTRLEDFDDQYPGTYAGRIEAVEVEIIGLAPPRGVSGSLTNGGVSIYRKPLSRVDKKPETRIRIQPRETLVLSDYNQRSDALSYTLDQRKSRIFEGAGLASTWRLELPQDINDLDFGSLTDVQLTFYYQARFDPELRQIIRQELASHPGYTARQRSLPLRWTFPDEFAGFLTSGDLQLELHSSDFPRNQLNPVLTNLGVVVFGTGGFSTTGLSLSLSAPGKPAQSGKTTSDGSLNFGKSSPLVGGSAIGAYSLSLRSGNGAALLQNGRMPIANLALILGYTFSPRG